ncbi:hypothetical protein ALC56_06061 [Trachymyrmex septentrionalis]|uniref:Gustatory receptor n=1 Tax=Trachymyrmex septentrionalis TaxID=34720 RepID=A0A195FH58_9HYME|nr:hypothetical protein ALC56_06061 [Trachymyrmex septentrionalis]
MKTLQTALAPLLIIGSFCSLGLFEYPLGQPKPYLSWWYALITWSYFTYSFYYPFYIWWEGTVSKCIDIIMIITAITSILGSHYHFKEMKMCLHELSIVDDTLEVLGSPKEYQQLRNWIIRITIGWIVLVFSNLLTVTLSWKIFSNLEHIYFVQIYHKFLLYHSIFVNILSALICGTIFGLVYSVSQNDRQIFCALIEQTKLSRKVIYHFAIFAVSKILIIKNRRILVFNNFLLKQYQLYRKTNDKYCFFFFHRFLTRRGYGVTLIAQ